MPKNYFQSGAERYAAYRPSYPSALAEALAGCAAYRKLAVDVGCGSGQLTRLLAPLFDEVIGVDPSASQLEQARSQAGDVSNLTFHEGPAEHIEAPDRSVDLIVAAQAAHWFELPEFYREVRRVAASGGVIVLVTYGVPYIHHWVNTIFQQGYWQRVYEFWPPERAHVESGYVDLEFPFSPIELPSFEQRKALTCREFIGYITTWSAYKNALARGAQERFDAFFARLEQAWPTSNACEVAWPIVARAGYVHA